MEINYITLPKVKCVNETEAQAYIKNNQPCYFDNAGSYYYVKNSQIHINADKILAIETTECEEVSRIHVGTTSFRVLAKIEEIKKILFKLELSKEIKKWKY